MSQKWSTTQITKWITWISRQWTNQLSKGHLLFAEVTTERQVAARGGCMERCPHLCVTSIDVSTSLHQQTHDVQSIVNTAL